MPFAKVQIGDNATGYAAAVAQLTEKMGPVQTCLTAYLALGVATVPTTADLADLWDRPQVFLERMLTGGQPVTLGGGGGGLPVAAGQVYGLLEKPAGTAAFLATVEEQRRFRLGSWLGGVPVQAYEVVNGTTLQIKQTTLDSVREQYRIYATTQAQKDEWDLLQTVAGALETIRQNGHFGAVFHPLDYLKDALHNSGYASDNLNPVRASAAYIIQTQRLQ